MAREGVWVIERYLTQAVGLRRRVGLNDDGEARWSPPLEQPALPISVWCDVRRVLRRTARAEAAGVEGTLLCTAAVQPGDGIELDGLLWPVCAVRAVCASDGNVLHRCVTLGALGRNSGGGQGGIRVL